MIDELMAAAEAAGIPIYGTDFLCRTLAILYCYGGGPGSEYFRAPVGMAVVRKASDMLEKAVEENDWSIIETYRSYVRQLQENQAPWLEKTLDRLNIPPKEIKYQECWR